MYVINKGDSFVSQRYIGETERNAKVRQNEHNNPTKSSEPSKHLLDMSCSYLTQT